MNIQDALKKIMQGKKVFRLCYENEKLYLRCEENGLSTGSNDTQECALDAEDIFTEDWEVEE